MKVNPKETGPGILRPLCIASLAIALSACGGSSTPTDDGTTTDGDGPGTGGVSNPDSIDVNGDGLLNAEDDWNFDNVVDQADVDAFAADGGVQTGGGDGTPDGNIASDCSAVDCVSGNAEWSDNAQVSQNRNPTSTYALGIQRILYCLSYGGTEDGTAIATYADGIYGPTTAANLETYQADNMLVEDGIVGGQTWEQLQSELQGPISFDDDFNYWIVPSARDECNAQILFYQRKADPMDWQQAAEPGSTTKIPFSINAQ